MTDAIANPDSPTVIISLVIPIFNERAVIDRLHQEVSEVMQSLRFSWEVIYVDDGSRDESLSRLRNLQEGDPHVVVIELSRNWGHQPAITAGLSQARGHAVIIMDGDLQDPPSVIPDLIRVWQGGAQVVIAERRSRSDTLIRKWLFIAFYKIFGFLSDYPVPLNAGVFGLLDRPAVEAITSLTETNRYLPGLRAWIGYRSVIVNYDRAPRAAGEPKQSYLRLLRYAFDAIFSFSYKPLRLSLVLGALTAMFALLFGITLVVCRLKGLGLFGIPVVNGYTTTIVSILFLGGVQLISVGIVGEYIGRIYDEVKRRPLFVINRIYRAENSNHESRRVQEA